MTKTPEQKVKSDICDWLSAKGCFFWVTPNGRSRGNHRYKRNGIPDIQGIWKGRPLYIEVKKLGGRLSMEQYKFIDEATKHGAIAFAAYKIEDVVKTFQDLEGETVK